MSALSESRPLTRRFLAAGLLAASLGVAGAAEAQTLIMGTNKVGTLFQATGAGVAKIIAQHSDVRITVRAYNTSDTFLRAIDRGEIAFGTSTGTGLWLARTGQGNFTKKHTNLRLLRASGPALRLTFAVRADSGIKSFADLKGRRVAGDYGGAATVLFNITAAIKAHGLDWSDFDVVPVPGVLQGPEAIRDGRADAAWVSFGMPILRELNTRTPIRYLPIENTPEQLAAIKRENPAYILVKTKARPDMGWPEDGYLLSEPTYLATSKFVSDEQITKVLTALWDYNAELQKIHFMLRSFTKDTAAPDNPLIPFHPAAIAFYKNKGVLSAQAEKRQAELLKEEM